MNKKYEDYEFRFEDMDEIDEDGFKDFYNTEDLYNTELMQTNRVFPPRGSFTHIPTNEFTLPDVEVDETIEALKKLKKYDNETKKK